MPSPFARAFAQADLDIDEHMGETIQVSPTRSGEFSRMPDPDRTDFDVIALVTGGDPSSAQLPKLDARVVHEEWTIEIRRALLGGRRIAKNDEIVLLDQPGGMRVKVNHVERDDESRLVLVCGPVAD